MSTFIIALGANIGDRESTFARAIERIEARVGILKASSSWHETKPLLNPDFPSEPQDDYLNGVIEVESTLEPAELMHYLLGIERALGRIREYEKHRWGPRVIDLDIISCEDLEIDTPLVRIPHPEMHKRDFVLRPMLEVAPDWQHPGLKKTVRELLAEL